MQIRENVSLKEFNTFSIDSKARYFSIFSSTDELAELLHLRQGLDRHVTYDARLLTHYSHLPPTFILGGGSNILVTKDYDGLVLKNEIKGIEVLHEDNEYMYIKAGAGENWHQFVMHCISHNWAGVENLSLIPGNTGAAPIQNIGAYGVELSDVFWNLEAFHLEENKVYNFTKNDCEFGYRDSVFKNRLKNQFVIISVTFQLKKKPVYHTSYGAMTEELDKMGVKDLSIKAISQAVINIRSSKLPDPAKIANAGSFFKNPVVSNDQFSKLKIQYPTMPSYPQADGAIKLAAGWLIEQCGPDDPDGYRDGTSWKGYRKADAGCHEKQALVLVNYGNAKGKEIYELSEEILQSVKDKYGVLLEREVNIV